MGYKRTGSLTEQIMGKEKVEEYDPETSTKAAKNSFGKSKAIIWGRKIKSLHICLAMIWKSNGSV